MAMLTPRFTTILPDMKPASLLLDWWWIVRRLVERGVAQAQYVNLLLRDWISASMHMTFVKHLLTS